MDDWHKELITRADHLVVVTDLDFNHCLRVQQETSGMDFHLVINKDLTVDVPIDVEALIQEPLIKIPYHKKIYDDIALGEPSVFHPDLQKRFNAILEQVKSRKPGRPKKVSL